MVHSRQDAAPTALRYSRGSGILPRFSALAHIFVSAIKNPSPTFADEGVRLFELY